jgi:mono/diheme cytochrome c family protein
LLLSSYANEIVPGAGWIAIAIGFGVSACSARGGSSMTLRFCIAFVTLAVCTGGAWAEGPDGATLFGTHCARCHGSAGRTDTPSARALKVRPLADDPELAQMSAAAILDLVRTTPKHGGVGAPIHLGEVDGLAVAAFVRDLARGH